MPSFFCLFYLFLFFPRRFLFPCCSRGSRLLRLSFFFSVYGWYFLQLLLLLVPSWDCICSCISSVTRPITSGTSVLRVESNPPLVPFASFFPLLSDSHMDSIDKFPSRVDSIIVASFSLKSSPSWSLFILCCLPPFKRWFVLFFCPVLSSGSARSPFATVSVFNVSRRLIRESMISHWKLCAYYSPCLFLLLLLFHFDCVGRGRGGGRDDSYRSNDAGRSGWGGGGGGNSYAPPDDYHRQQQQGRGYGHDQPNRYAHSLLYRFSIWIVQQLGGSRAGE